MISRAVDAQKMNFQYTRTGVTNNSAKQPCLSLSDHSAAVLQQIGGVLPMFYDVILVRLRHHVVKQMSFEQYSYFMMPTESKL